MNTIAKRAYEKFTKTRITASKASLKSSHIVEAEKVNFVLNFIKIKSKNHKNPIFPFITYFR